MKKKIILVCVLTAVFIGGWFAGSVKPQHVWAIEYERIDYSDHNEYFKNKEDADAALQKDFQTHSGYWKEPAVVAEGKDWKLWEFTIWCEDDQQDEVIKAMVHQIPLQ